MQSLLQDIRYALRQLRKSPGFTFTAVLTLALGIGANSAIFTLVYAVMLRNLPVADPKTLVRVGDKDDCCVNGGTPTNNDYSLFSNELYKYLKDNSPEFEQLAAVQAGVGAGSITARSNLDEVPKSLEEEFVSGNYFQTLGLSPLAGRLLAPSDDVAGAPPVAVISYRTWQRDYGLNPSVVDSTFLLNSHPVTIIGITPPAFYSERMTSTPPDFYIPFADEPMIAAGLIKERKANWVYLIGRVRLGTERGPLQAKMSGRLRQWLATLELYQKQDEKENLAKSHVVLTPGGGGIANMQQEYASGLHLLVGISGLVLLIACANIANLVLARSMARRAETSIRMALGAQRRRVIRQMLTESVVLSSIGGLAGLFVAYAGTKLLLALAFPDSPDIPINASPSLSLLAFAFGLSLLTGLIFGSAPAFATSHSEPAEALRGSNRSTRDSSSLLQRSLVVVQAALSLVLLVGAGLMSKSLARLEHQDFGLQTDNRVVIHISPANAGYKLEGLPPLYEQIDQRLRSIPGIERVALSLYSPLEGNNWSQQVSVQGRPEPGAKDDVDTTWLRVSPEFFDVIGQHVVRGRGITPQDTPASRGITVVNQAFVKKFFPQGEEPIGMHFGTAGVESSGDFEIVGVVNDVKYTAPREAPRPMFFRPLLQISARSPQTDNGQFIGAITLRTRGAVPGLETEVRKTLASISPNLTVVRYSTFGAQISGQFNQERLIARLTTFFGGLALLLASVGLYGVTAYLVERRTPEIGIRMALGAGRGSVVAMVWRGAMLQAGIGLVLGIPVALLCVRFVQAQLYGVEGNDATVLLGATFALIASASIAAAIPAQRAASTDPTKAPRAE